MLMVLWGMMIMGMAVGGLIQYMRHSVLEDVDASKEYQARLLAESGIALALHPRMKKNDPLLHQQISPVKRYDVTVSTEGARIAINQIATKPEVHAYCQKLFVIWGMNPESSGVLADSLKDWIDADERVSPLGAEDGHYTLRGAPHYPRNEPFRHLDEMLLVRGMHELARRKPNWKDHFTLYGDGKIDVNEASAELLEVVCDVPRAQAEVVVLRRRGPDTIQGTEDDEPYDDFADVQDALGLSRWDFRDVEPRLTLMHPIRRVMSIGQAGDFRQALTAILGPGLDLIKEHQASPSGAMVLKLGRDQGAP